MFFLFCFFCFESVVSHDQGQVNLQEFMAICQWPELLIEQYYQPAKGYMENEERIVEN